jgi:hypothetical protein
MTGPGIFGSVPVLSAAERAKRDERDAAEAERRDRDLHQGIEEARRSPKRVAQLSINDSERLTISVDRERDTILLEWDDFEKIPPREGTWRTRDASTIPMTIGGDICDLLRRDGVATRSFKADNGELILVPVLDSCNGEIRLLFAKSDGLRRAALFANEERRRLYVAFEQARARGLDLSLLSEAVNAMGSEQ